MKNSLSAKPEVAETLSDFGSNKAIGKTVGAQHFSPGAVEGPKGASATLARTKAREDTIAGCEALAASDLSRAALTDTENGRRKFQLSAESWHARAALLGRLGVSAEKRRFLDRAEWQEADAVEREFPTIDQDPSYGISGDPS